MLHKNPVPGPNARALLARDSEVVSPSYPRDYPFVMSHGSGSEVWDVDGYRYIDCVAGIAVCSTGHSHPDVVRAIREQAGKFIEWAQVHGDLYGTPRANVEKIPQGADLVLEIDTEGARKIKEAFGDAVLIFILPPSLGVLEGRLRSRGGDAKEAIEARLHNAQKELDQIARYDYIVVNKEIEEATREVASIVIAERCKAARVLALRWGGTHGTDNG